MGLGNYPFELLSEIQKITKHQLKRFSIKQICKSFLGVEKVLADFRRNYPDQIMAKLDGSLVNIGPISMNDFELAYHLSGTNDSEMAKVFSESEGVPVLMAYLEVLTNSRDLPDEFLLASALSYAVRVRTFQGDVAKLWNKDLLPLAAKGLKHGSNQAARRSGKTKLSDSEKRQIVREYDAALVTYGTIKSLARKFDVSVETIKRALSGD